jgi:hypothetical protein
MTAELAQVNLNDSLMRINVSTIPILKNKFTQDYLAGIIFQHTCFGVFASPPLTEVLFSNHHQLVRLNDATLPLIFDVLGHVDFIDKDTGKVEVSALESWPQSDFISGQKRLECLQQFRRPARGRVNSVDVVEDGLSWLNQFVKRKCTQVSQKVQGQIELLFVLGESDAHHATGVVLIFVHHLKGKSSVAVGHKY